MLTLKRITIDFFVEELRQVYQRTYSDLEPEFGNIIVWTGRLALENIANSDALYHDLEHTMMVALAGQAILEGKHFCEGGVSPRDWLHFMIAVLCHDIGYEFYIGIHMVFHRQHESSVVVRRIHAVGGNMGMEISRHCGRTSHPT